MPLSLRRRLLLLATLCSPVLAPAAESAWQSELPHCTDPGAFCH